MQIEQSFVLIAKDLRIHGRALGIIAAGFLCFIFVVSRLFLHDHAVYSPASRVVFIINVNFIAASFLWGDWFISREKTKGTFAWLRSLPLDDGTIVVSKIATGVLCSASLWTVSVLLYARTFFFPSQYVLWCIILLFFIDFTILSFASRWVLKQKAGTVAPVLVVALLVLTATGLQRAKLVSRDDVLHLWSQPWAGAMLITILGTGAVLLTALLVLWLKNVDTDKWLE